MLVRHPGGELSLSDLQVTVMDYSSIVSPSDTAVPPTAETMLHSGDYCE
jgi:hypothetical protein